VGNLTEGAAARGGAAASFAEENVRAGAYAVGGLLTVEHLTVADVAEILAATARLEAMTREQRARVLEGRTIALLFYESSTRTRTSFELAAKSLGATTTLVSDKSSSIEKGESLKDTGLTLRALGAEAIVLRHPSSGAADLLARVTGLPVLTRATECISIRRRRCWICGRSCCGWGAISHPSRAWMGHPSLRECWTA
jgi:hypothetical protein